MLNYQGVAHISSDVASMRSAFLHVSTVSLEGSYAPFFLSCGLSNLSTSWAGAVGQSDPPESGEISPSSYHPRSVHTSQWSQSGHRANSDEFWRVFIRFQEISRLPGRAGHHRAPRYWLQAWCSSLPSSVRSQLEPQVLRWRWGAPWDSEDDQHSCWTWALIVDLLMKHDIMMVSVMFTDFRYCKKNSIFFNDVPWFSMI